MRKKLFAVLSVIVLCSLCFMGITRIAKAVNSAYTITDGQGTLVTVDGIVSPGEWDDSDHGYLFSGSTMTNNTFHVKWAEVNSNLYYDQWLFEIFSDTTNDTGDFIQVCYDSNQDGGTAPKTDDYLVNYTGHNTATVYKGTGTGWAPTSDFAVIAASTIGASPASATPHWIIEIQFEDPWESTDDRVAAYDASNSSAGVLTWPPQSSANVPNDYGLSEISYTSIPEGLTVGVVALLSTFAVIVSSRYFLKRPKTEKCSQVKL